LKAIYLPQEFHEEALREAKWKNISFTVKGDFLFFKPEPESFSWSLCGWNDLQEIQFSSISDAAKKLRPLAKKWFHYSPELHRRSQLIADSLREWKLEMPFAQWPEVSKEGVGAFTLTSPQALLWTKSFDSAFGPMPPKFMESKEAPSRAYLKLWDAFASMGKYPKKGEQCLELGASPGGWTWVLESFGAHTIAIDRSPLREDLVNSTLVEFQKGDAFTFSPEKVGRDIDWLVSDLICYPEKLLEFLEVWIRSEKVKNIIATIKLQGESDPAIIAAFEKWGRVSHLLHNKNELTFFYEKDLG